LAVPDLRQGADFQEEPRFLATADLFCRVVDNYGDIGVCWRLARQLVHGHGWNLRLWVDDLIAFARIEPGIDPRLMSQNVAGIDIVQWTQPAPDLAPRDIVIEAFACDPPPAYVHRMQDMLRRPIWINLEYLSAEDWIEACHALPSPQAGGLLKHFFFPGFTERSGGLLREPDLARERDAIRSDPGARAAWLARLGLPPTPANGRLVTLFCYADAPASVLVQALAAEDRPSLLVVPHGVAPHLPTGAHGAAHIVRIPFLSQPDYDRLLWCADLNFVRGEDSFVRAQLAARPMVWHIYPQEGATHIDKLAAWLARYPAPAAARDINTAWNGETGADELGRRLHAGLAPGAWAQWANDAAAWGRTLTAQSGLAQRLVQFCQTLRASGH
jgi:uncharacterized repeat protein (TIGR03837 family)